MVGVEDFLVIEILKVCCTCPLPLVFFFYIYIYIYIHESLSFIFLHRFIHGYITHSLFTTFTHF